MAQHKENCLGQHKATGPPRTIVYLPCAAIFVCQTFLIQNLKFLFHYYGEAKTYFFILSLRHFRLNPQFLFFCPVKAFCLQFQLELTQFLTLSICTRTKIIYIWKKEIFCQKKKINHVYWPPMHVSDSRPRVSVRWQLPWSYDACAWGARYGDRRLRTTFRGVLRDQMSRRMLPEILWSLIDRLKY